MQYPRDTQHTTSRDKRKDPSIKIRNLVFYSPSKEELQRCSTSRDYKTQKFLRDESSIKFHNVLESSRDLTDEILTKGEPGLNQSQTISSPGVLLPDTKSQLSDNRNITPQKLVPRPSKGQQGLPSLGRGSKRELEKSMVSPSAEKESVQELIEGALAKENKAELTKIYKAARDFQDLKLTKEKERLRSTRDSERIKAAMTKLLDDQATNLSHNVQNIRTDISHYFNEKRSKSPEQSLPDVKDQFKKKFHKLLQDINDDSKLSPERNNGFTTNKIASNLLDNNLKSSRFLNCEASPPRRNVVFNTLHKDIRSVRTPIGRVQHEREPSYNDKSQNSMSSSQVYFKCVGNNSDAFDENVIQALRKELPNLFSSNPSNRQEVLVLGNWLINIIKSIQEDGQLSSKEKFYKADEMYNLCFNELIRQVSFDCMERAELMMKIWKAYMSLSQDIVDGFKEREKQVIAKANQQCEEIKEMYQKMLDEKDKDIERIKEELRQKDDILKERNDRIGRFNEDQSSNINQARQATEAFNKVQKLFLSLKKEHKDVNFKYEKIKGRLGAADLEEFNNHINSDTSSEDENKGVPMFGLRQFKIIKRDHKETSTADLMEIMRAGQEAPGISTQTDLALMHKRYNPILKNNGVLDDILREKAAKRKLEREGELVENMKGKWDREFRDKESASVNTVMERRRASQVGSDTRRASIMSHGEEMTFGAGKKNLSGSQVLDIVQEKRSFKVKVSNDQQPSQTLHSFGSAKLLPKIDMRRESIMSTRSDRIMRNSITGENHQPDTDRSPGDLMGQTAEFSETESIVDCKGTKVEHIKTHSGDFEPKPSQKAKIKNRNSVREAYYGVPDKSSALDKAGIKRGDSTPKKLLITAQKGGTSKKTVSSKKNGIEVEIPPLDGIASLKNQSDSLDLPKQKTGRTAKRDNKREPESGKSIDSSNSLATANEEFKSSLRTTRSGFAGVAESSVNLKNKAKQIEAGKKDFVGEISDMQKSVKSEMMRTITASDNLSSLNTKSYALNLPLLSPITSKGLNAQDQLTPSVLDLKATTSMGLDESPRDKSEAPSFISRDSRPVRTVASAIKAIKRIATAKDFEKKVKALNGIAETLAQIDEDNEAAAHLMETQEQKIVRFTNLYKIEKKKQEDLRALNRELEKQVIHDGVVIDNYQRLVEELTQVSELTDAQRRKIETLVSLLEIRSKNLKAIDELKPRLDPAFTGSIMQDIRLASESPRRRLFEEQFTLSSLLPESRYKGDFMVDVVLSPGQKHLLSEKIHNPMQATLAKVKRDLQSKKAKASATMPVKSLLKQITIFYQEKVHQGKDNPMLKEQDMCTFVYKQFINTYGLGKFAVRKFIKFVASLKRHINIHRVNNFAKMLNVLDNEESYSLAEARQYLQGLEFFMYHSTAGIHYPNPDHQKSHYIPFSKALEYLRFYTERHGQEEDLYNFKKDLEKLRIVDPSRINASGLIDVDIFLEKIVVRHNRLLAKAEEALLTGFTSGDFCKDNRVRFADFLVLYKAIEGDRNEDKKLEEMFVSYCDLVDADHLALSKEKFLALSFDLNFFSKQKLNAYLGVKDEIEFDKKFEVFKSKWEEEEASITANIEKCQASLPHEVIAKWRNILDMIGEDMEKTEAYIRKSILIRHRILTADIANNTPIG